MASGGVKRSLSAPENCKSDSYKKPEAIGFSAGTNRCRRIEVPHGKPWIFGRERPARVVLPAARCQAISSGHSRLLVPDAPQGCRTLRVLLSDRGSARQLSVHRTQTTKHLVNLLDFRRSRGQLAVACKRHQCRWIVPILVWADSPWQKPAALALSLICHCARSDSPVRCSRTAPFSGAPRFGPRPPSCSCSCAGGGAGLSPRPECQAHMPEACLPLTHRTTPRTASIEFFSLA